MKKFVRILSTGLIIGLMTIIFAGCSKSNSSVNSSAAISGKNVPVLKFNSVKTANDADYLIWVNFFERIEEAAKGTIVIEKYPSEALGKAVDMIEAAKMGNPVIQDCDTNHLADNVPDFGIFQQPYLLSDPGQIEYLWQSDWGQGLCRQLESKGLHVVTIAYFGTRHLISNRAVRTRDDAKGMLIRCAPVKMWNQVAIVLGGNPTPTAWSEVYQALSQGVADGAESPFALLYSAKLYEVRKNISLTGHLTANIVMVMSQAVYESLPAEAKAVMDKIGIEQCQVSVDTVTGQENSWRTKLEAEGVKFHEVDRASFIAAAANVGKEFPEWTPGLYNKIQDILKDYRPKK
jgi:tripartite ATP-independent transporter DctP family solute receptor